MTTQEMLEQLPANTPDEEELQALFGGTDMQHHLYGVHIPAADSYPVPEPAHWRCTCSVCGQVFAVPDNRRLKDITVCPKCGAAVAPHRWTVPQGKAHQCVSVLSSVPRAGALDLGAQLEGVPMADSRGGRDC